MLEATHTTTGSFVSPMKLLRFVSSEGGAPFGLDAFLLANVDSDNDLVAQWVADLCALPLGGTWSEDHGPTLTRVEDAPGTPVTLDTMANAIAFASARISTLEDRALVDAAEAEMLFARTSEGDVTESLLAAVLALEPVAKREPAELTRKVIGSKGDEYILTREHGAAPWRTCSCLSFTKGRWTNGAATPCKHLKASNGAVTVVAAAMAPVAEAAPVPPAAVEPERPVEALAPGFRPETVRAFEGRLRRVERMSGDWRRYVGERQKLVGDMQAAEYASDMGGVLPRAGIGR